MRVYVDIVIENLEGKILLVDRGVEPYGWAIPGGYVDENETPLQAAVREVREETAAKIEVVEQFCVYPFVRSEKNCTAITIVYVARLSENTRLEASSDVVDLAFYETDKLPLLIDAHNLILADYIKWKTSKLRPNPKGNLIATRDEELHVPAKPSQILSAA